MNYYILNSRVFDREFIFRILWILKSRGNSFFQLEYTFFRRDVYINPVVLLLFTIHFRLRW